MADQAAAGDRRFLTFRVAGQCYALGVERVIEVTSVPMVTRVPHSPPALLGVANLRGFVLPLISMRGLLALGDPPAPADDERLAARAIVVQAGTSVALVVDAVQALERIDEAVVAAGQAELVEADGERLSGAYRSPTTGAVVRILDLDALLRAAFAQRERRLQRPGAQPGAAMPSTQGRTGERGSLASLPSEASNTLRRLVSVEVAGQAFAFDLAVVREVIAIDDGGVAMPRSDAAVLGVTSLRGALLPLLSLRSLLGLPMAARNDDRDRIDREKIVVIDVDDAQVGLRVDAALSVLAARDQAIDPVPTVLAARQQGESRIRAIYRADGGRRLVSILAAEQLFREDVMQRLRERSRQKVPLPGAPIANGVALTSILVFRLGDDVYGLPIEAVDEVAQLPEQITRVPRTPKFLEGVINLRGVVLPVVDLRRRFEMPAASDLTRRRLIVARTERHRAGLIVDGGADVLRVALDDIAPPPDLTDEIAALIRGVITLPDRQQIVLLLDPQELLTQAERGLLDRFAANQGLAPA